MLTSSQTRSIEPSLQIFLQIVSPGKRENFVCQLEVPCWYNQVFSTDSSYEVIILQTETENVFTLQNLN